MLDYDDKSDFEYMKTKLEKKISEDANFAKRYKSIIKKYGIKLTKKRLKK